jgi:hypothetical protein
MTDSHKRRRPGWVERVVQHIPGGDFLLSGPRAFGFVHRPRRTDDGGDRPSEIPAAPRSLPFTAAAMVDEMAIAWMRIGRLNPKPDEIERIVAETRTAEQLFLSEGWLDDPSSFHAQPPSPTDVTIRRAARRGVEYERISFDSEFDPDPESPDATAGWRTSATSAPGRGSSVRLPTSRGRGSSTCTASGWAGRTT